MFQCSRCVDFYQFEAGMFTIKCQRCCKGVVRMDFSEETEERKEDFKCAKCKQKVLLIGVSKRL
jgi:hypothetical protein